MKYIIYVLFIIFGFFNISFAKDYYIENNGEISVIISKNNLNRIKVFRDRIKEVISNANELKIDIDRINGELYIKPTVNKEKIDLFIKTENNYVYKIILKIKEIDSQQVFLNRDEFTLKKYADSSILRREKLNLLDEDLYFDFETDYKISAINLIKAMSTKTKLNEFTIVNRNEQELLNYDNFKVKWLLSYLKNDKTNTISGEVLKIINKSNDKIQLEEDIFFRNGVRAIKIDKTELLPHESCFLYFVGGNTKWEI